MKTDKILNLLHRSDHLCILYNDRNIDIKSCLHPLFSFCMNTLNSTVKSIWHLLMTFVFSNSSSCLSTIFEAFFKSGFFEKKSYMQPIVKILWQTVCLSVKHNQQISTTNFLGKYVFSRTPIQNYIIWFQLAVLLWV